MNGSTIPASPSGSPEQPARAERREQRDAGDRRRQDERQLDERDRERAPAERARREQVGDRRADRDDEDVGDRVRPDRDRDRVAHRRVAAGASGTLRERDLGEQRDERQREERERDAGGEREERGEARAPRARLARCVPPPLPARRQAEAEALQDARGRCVDEDAAA